MINSKLEILRNDLKYRDTYRIITSVSRYVSYRVMSVSSQPYFIFIGIKIMDQNGYGPKWCKPKWSWAEMVMGRNDPEPLMGVTRKQRNKKKKKLISHTF